MNRSEHRRSSTRIGVIASLVVVAVLGSFVPGLPGTGTAYPAEPRPDVLVMPVGDSITSGSTNALGPQATYRMFLFDQLVANGLDTGSGFTFVGPYDSHPDPGIGYQRPGEWPHDALAVSGWRTSNVLVSLGSAVTTHEPDVLLVLIGVNDLRASVSPARAAGNVEQALRDGLSASPGVGVLLAEIPPADAPDIEVVAQYNAQLRDVATRLRTEGAAVWTVDLFTDYDMELLHFDGLHPNDMGDEFIAARFAAALLEQFDVGSPSDYLPDDDPVQDPPALSTPPPGQVMVRLGDREVAVALERVENTLVAVIDGVELRVRNESRDWGDGTPWPLTLLADDRLSVELIGLRAGSALDVWLRSEPTLVSTSQADAAGLARAEVGTLGAVASGCSHALQLAASAADGSPIGFAIPVELLPEQPLFTDVPVDGTHAAAMACLAEDGIVTGRGDGTFGPRLEVNRGQVASFLARALQLESGSEPRMTDVAGSTHAASIAAVHEAGIMSGYPDGTFRPHVALTRAQAATVLAAAMGLEPIEERWFADVAEGSTHAGAIHALVHAGISRGVTDDRFEPDASITRQQWVSLLHQSLSTGGRDGSEPRHVRLSYTTPE